MKKLLLLLVALSAIVCASCVPASPASTEELTAPVRIYDRDIIKQMYCDTIFGQWADDVQEDLLLWQKEHLDAQILRVETSVGFKVVITTITYQK